MIRLGCGLMLGWFEIIYRYLFLLGDGNVGTCWNEATIARARSDDDGSDGDFDGVVVVLAYIISTAVVSRTGTTTRNTPGTQTTSNAWLCCSVVQMRMETICFLLTILCLYPVCMHSLSAHRGYCIDKCHTTQVDMIMMGIRFTQTTSSISLTPTLVWICGRHSTLYSVLCLHSMHVIAASSRYRIAVRVEDSLYTPAETLIHFALCG